MENPRMRKLKLGAVVLAAATSLLVGCNKAEELLTSNKDRAKQARETLDARLAESEKATQALEQEGAAASASAAEEALGSGGAAGAAEEEKSLAERFQAELVEAGFVSVGLLPLLPDVLGGLVEECAAHDRTKVEMENEDWATLGIYEDAKHAKLCLDAYMKMPGAERFRSSYVLNGRLMLEVRPTMSGAEQTKIRSLFAKIAAAD